MCVCVCVCVCVWPNTDFETTTVENWVEIMSGGPPKDGIPAIDDPTFVAVADKPNLFAREPVIALEIEGEIPRAYPIRYLTWHEIVNDEGRFDISSPQMEVNALGR